MMGARSGFLRGRGSPPPQPGRSVIEPDELVALLRTLARLRGAGNTALSELADAVSLDDERLLALVRALETLGLLDVLEGRLRVTAMGRRFAQAHEDERKRIFAERLKSRVLVAAYVLGALQSHPERRLALALLERELRDEFAIEDAEASLHQAIAWGRYARLLSYDDATGLVSLEPADDAAG